MANTEGEGKNLSDIFDNLWTTYEFLERCDDPTPSKNVQDKVKNGISEGEEAVKMVNLLGLFSSNEQLEEVSSNEIKYMVLPGLLAYFTQKNTKEDRLETVKKAQIYYIDYLKLVKLYGVTSVEIPKIDDGRGEDKQEETKPASSGGMPDLAAMTRQRGNKIERYKQQKLTEEKLNELHKAVKSGKADDEIVREYHTTLLKKWINFSLDELDSIQEEIPILEHMSKMRKQGVNGSAQQNKPKEQPKKKFQPFILTRDKLQAQVIGAGYPSLPTYSVEEWAEQTYKDQIAAAKSGGSMQTNAMDPEIEKQQKEEDDVRKEAEVESDDPVALQRAREMDEYKDEHRRGWGNRQNRL